LAKLAPAFDRVSGTLTAGNSSPLTDGAAAVWIADEEGLRRLAPGLAVAEIVDWQLAAVDFLKEGMLMAPAFAIPRLLARHGLKFEDIALWEIHEAFAAQVLANVRLMSDPLFTTKRLGIAFDFGEFPWARVNPNGGCASHSSGSRVGACYSHIAHAPEGNVALDDYAHARAWLQRVEMLPGFVPMAGSKVGLAA
jgi:acetyl-CoA acetyltransferase